MTSPQLPPSGVTAPPRDPFGLDQPLRGATIGEAASRFWRKYATFSGRASRSEFWWWYLISGLVSLALTGVQRAIDGPAGAGQLFTLGEIPSDLWSLATLVPTLAITTRRLHDINRSGWWQLLPLAPAVIMLVAVLPTFGSDDLAGGAIAGVVIGAIGVLVCCIVLIVWLATDSKHEGERFDR